MRYYRTRGAKRRCSYDHVGKEGEGSSQALCKASARRRPATEQSEGAQLGAPTKRA